MLLPEFWSISISISILVSKKKISSSFFLFYIISFIVGISSSISKGGKRPVNLLSKFEIIPSKSLWCLIIFWWWLRHWSGVRVTINWLSFRNTLFIFLFNGQISISLFYFTNSKNFVFSSGVHLLEFLIPFLLPFDFFFLKLLLEGRFGLYSSSVFCL